MLNFKDLVNKRVFFSGKNQLCFQIKIGGQNRKILGPGAGKHKYRNLTHYRFDSTQLEWDLISTIINVAYELDNKLPNILMLRILGNYNHFHNILRPFDVLLHFTFTTSETKRDYYY